MAASLDQRGADTPARMCPSHRELVQICGLPLRASGQNSGSSADKVQQPTMPSLQLATRSSDLRTKVSANVRSIRATSQAGVPWRTSTPQRRASAAQPRRYHPSRRPERSEAPRCPFAPWRGMNRRLIVQFDPDEPSMSAPTFAEPDQGPLAGGRKVNARHDLTLGLWRRDCEISRGFPRR
jgi:hypothetical protein